MKLRDRLNEVILLTEFVRPEVIENHIRDHLSGTNRRVTRDTMYRLASDGLSVRHLNKADFIKVWNNLVDEGYLKFAGQKTYRWEM